MKNLRKCFIGVLVLAVICNAQAVDSEEDYDDYQMRANKVTKGSKKSSDKETKKQNLNQKVQQTLRDSTNANQRQENPVKNDLLTNLNRDPTNELLASFPNGQRGTDGLGINSLMGQQMQNYAAHFPYPGVPYIPQNMGHQNMVELQSNFNGYFNGNPNALPQNVPYHVQLMPQEHNNFNLNNYNQNPQSSIPSPIPGNILLNHIPSAEQTGLQSNEVIPRQQFFNAQPFPWGPQAQQGFLNPFGNLIPDIFNQQQILQNQLEMPFANIPPMYHRFQRALKENTEKV